MRSVTFRQLRVFTEVARHLSFSQAAESLHLTPPAVTMQVKELEGHVGMPLFERQGRQVQLTMAGEYFLVYAKRLLSTLKDADNVMARFKRVETGVLTIGLLSTAGYFLPALLARFQSEHPGVDVRLDVTRDLTKLMDRLHSNEIDLAVMGRPPKGEYALRSEPFAGHPMVFVCPPGHPLLGVGHPPIEALVHYPLIVRELGSEVRHVLDNYLREHRLAPRIAMEIPSNETIKASVMAGLGISFISLHAVAAELRAGQLHRVEFEGTPVIRTWNIVHEASKVLSPAAEAFRYLMLEHGEALISEHSVSLLGSSP
ncbi:MAG TPA: LysR family transcriptional regulator [Aquabacterium sp.]|uniref:LysR family transcriptional regulator n=1 Tax=Aquabacterium sp. TaxID=1872578 RepID=UPI002DA123CE|nr:LysR family transcriptional regulator [Aquabacterium sp.]HET6786980.1 LysR family transcriptional regulator [Aquabacterium sp.]HEX5372745.1 LysR family transcriptional regulator [Aquabacterium sp.]